MQVDRIVPFLKSCVPELVASVLLSVPFSVSDEWLDTGGFSLDSVLSWRTALMCIGCFAFLVVLRLVIDRQLSSAASATRKPKRRHQKRPFRSKARAALSWVFSEGHLRRTVSAA